MTDGTRDDGSERPTGRPDSHVRVDGGRPLLNDLLDVLSSHRRRYLLYYLQGTETADVDEITNHVVEELEDSSGSPAPAERFERTKANVVHTDLPKLRELGIVEYDPRTGAVRYRQPTQCLTALLRVCSELESQSSSSE